MISGLSGRLVVTGDVVRDPRPTFSRAVVRRVWELQGGCAPRANGRSRSTSARDHIHPWIAGGLTLLRARRSP